MPLLVCSDGLCQGICPAGLALCSGACVDLTTDEAHCGSCDIACEAGDVCANGDCMSPED